VRHGHQRNPAPVHHRIIIRYATTTPEVS